MKITVLTVGTRGDVQPYLALAVALQARGHHVRLATDDTFESWVRGWGVEFFPLRANFQALIESEEGRRALSNPLSSGRFLRRTVTPMFTEMLDDTWAAAQGAEALIYHPKVFSGPSLAERLGIPAALAATVPVVTPTAAFALPGLASRSLGRRLNRASYRLTALSLAPFTGVLSRWRQQIGLPARSGRGGLRTAGERMLPALYCYSPQVLPPPPDWDAGNHVLGAWALPPRAFTPDPDLERFLAAGPPPVYVGFGSMAGLDPARTTGTVTEALERAGVRGVLATGWGGLKPPALSDRVYALEAVPHEWLFPRVAAVAHHGGAGTTAAGLTAGRPTVICPFGADQPFWGRVVQRLGVGTAPVPQKTLSADRLTAALRQATQDAVMRQRAEALGQRLRAEDGVGDAVRWVEANLAGPARPADPPRTRSG